MGYRSAVITLSLLMAILTGSSQCFANTKATLLVQDSTVAGPQNVYVSARAIRIDNQRTGTTIVCKAPKWTVQLYNKRNRTMFQTPNQNFRAAFFTEVTRGYKDNWATQKWKKESEEVRDGVNISKFTVTLPAKDSRLVLLQMSIRNAEYSLATSFKLPDKACNVLSKLCSTPQLNLIPIGCTFYGPKGETTKLLNTKSIKEVNVIDPFFDMPKFPEAESERDVFIDATAREAMQDMFGEPGGSAKSK